MWSKKVPTITKIESQKNKNRVNIFVDDFFFCGLNKETAIACGLKVDREIDEKYLKDVIFESEVKSAIEKALNYVAIRMHTKKELLDKLVLKGFEKDVVLKAIDKLEEYHYVDDELYAKRFVSENKKYSKKMLYEKLSLKGVNREIIGNVLQSIDDDSEYELCLKMAEKYTKNKKIETINDLRKMQQSLARKGFSFDLVSKVSKQVTRNDLE